MNIVRSAGVPFIVLLFATAGCAEPGGGLGVDGDEPTARPATVKNGAGGNNGLDSAIYHAHLAELVDITEHALLDEESGQIGKSVLGTDLLSTPEGAQLFAYAVGCALPAGQQLPHGTEPFVGKGYLTTTTGWATAALSAAARDDLLACVAAHVNSTTGVPILLSGPTILHDGGAHEDFDVEEALWHVEQNVAGDIEHHVWPLSDFEEDCDSDPWAALEERICGQAPEDCHFVARYDRATACVEDPQSNGYVCDGLPVLKTTLKSADVAVLHPWCSRPAR